MRGVAWKFAVERATTELKAKDYRGYRNVLRAIHREFPDSSHVVNQLALVEGQLQENTAAVRWLRVYTGMGLVPELADPRLAGLARASQMDEIRRTTQANSSPVSRSSIVFRLADSNLIVEDIAYDPLSKSIFLSSVHERKILKCTMKGGCADFFSAANSGNVPVWSVLALRADSHRNVLWATIAGMNTEANFQSQDDGKSALLKIDLRTGRLIKRYEPADGEKHALGDMAVSRSGDAYVSDGESGDVYVVRHSSDVLERLVPSGSFRSPQTPALSSDEKMLFVPDYAMGLFVIRLADMRISAVTSKSAEAEDGTDGLYFTGDSLIAVQNGIHPERIVRFGLNEKLTITSSQVLEANWAGFGDPTHGVLVGHEFYFIANSGWDRVKDNGTIAPGKPAEIRKFSL